MVRVISVYNFLKQDVTSIDEVSAVAAVPPDILLIVQTNNAILVKDLSTPNDMGYTIPTVDQAIKIVYSIQGNYIAALENKITRNGTKVSYVRVYVNWETLKNCKNSYPLRARIAGRVTPLSHVQQGLEMIEIPLLHMPDNVCCCSVSGNLLVCSRNSLSLFNFVTQTHDISKIHFIDFKQLTVDLLLSFVPTKVQLLENFVAALNDEYLHVFQVKSSVPMCSLSDKEFSIDDIEKDQQSCPKSNKHKTINYEKLLKEVEEKNYSTGLSNSFEWHKNNAKYLDSEESEMSKINSLSFPIRHEFPTVFLEKSLIDSKYPNVLRQNPFNPSCDLTVNLIPSSPSEKSSINQFKIVNVCQYHLVPLTRGSVTNREIEEKFVFLILKPYYSEEGENDKAMKQRIFESDYYGNLKCIACFFGTQQEGYLHCFEFENVANEIVITSGKYVTYPFTAPVIDVQLDDCFVHVITEAGLETNTLRGAKHLIKKTDSTDCPSSKDPVCLIGLHPFVNVLKMTITNNYLILFANNEESSWTIYQLQSPDTACVWRNFLCAAEDNKWEAPLIYSELLGEGHLILKTRFKTIKWVSKKDYTKSHLHICEIESNNVEKEKIELLYKESCALLGDYHVINGNHKSFYCYYTMSGFKIGDVIKRVLGLWETIPEKHRSNYDKKKITEGLIFFLKKTLFAYDLKYYDFVGNKEEFYTPEIGTLVGSLMDFLEKEEKDSISDLILESVVLREFSTDRILKILKSFLSKSTVPQDKDALSLALMCIQRDQNDQAKTVLLTMMPTRLEALLLQYYDLLFASHNSNGSNMFTELSMVLIEIYPNVLAAVLSNLVAVKRLLSLSKVINFFIELMPSGGVRAKNASFVLKIVLEKYFKHYLENFNSSKFDSKATEAIKILIRIYLMQLQNSNGVEKDQEEVNLSEILFYNSRFKYLIQLPPFGPDFSEIFSAQDEGSSRKDADKEKRVVLMKIQSLLSYDCLPAECRVEVRNYLCNQTNVYGSLSLQILCSPCTQEAIDTLINFAPQALCAFSKERVVLKEDWKYLLEQLQKKISETNEDSRRQFYLQQILSEILHHIAENLNIEDLIDVIPKDYEDTERYLAIAQSNSQANHIKTLIMITGKQLLASL